MNGDIKIGKLLCDEDIITKRQLNKALQSQVKGDKRTLGEILVDLGFCDFDDITNALLGSDEDTKHHEEKEPIEISEEKVMGTKFSMSVQTIVGLVALISSGVGGYYMLLQEIEEAKELPKINIEEIFTDEYPSKPEGHNWPRSFEQYKNQVGGLQDDMDLVYETIEELEETIKELEKDIKDLERRKKDK